MDHVGVAIYCRVSSREQVEGYSIDAQVRACREWAVQRGWQVVAEYVEEARSARHDDVRKRPEFQRMLEGAEQGCYRALIVHKLDRFARNLKVMVLSLDRLSKAGVSFHSVTESIDETPQGRMMVGLLGTFAEWFSNNLSAETRKGKAERNRQGLWNGSLPFGVVTGSDGVPVKGDAWRGVELAFGMAAEGHTDMQVAHALNAAGYRTACHQGAHLWTKSGVRTVIRNRFYLGELPGGTPGVQGQLLDADLFERAQEGRARNLLRRGAVCVTSRAQVYSLSGLLVCGYCGGRCHISKSHVSVAVYCYSRSQGHPCGFRQRRLSVVEAQVEAWLADLVVDSQLMERAERLDSPDFVVDGSAERRRVEARIARLKEMYEYGDLDRDEYRAKLAEAQKLLLMLRPTTRGTIVEGARILAGLADAWRVALGSERNALLHNVVECIIVTDTGISVNVLPIYRGLLEG